MNYNCELSIASIYKNVLKIIKIRIKMNQRINNK